MNEQLLPWVVGLGVPVLVAIALRLLPKAKLISWAQTTGNRLGRLLSSVLLLRLGRKAAESIEEGIIVTLLATGQAFIDSFGKGLLFDNEERNHN